MWCEQCSRIGFIVDTFGLTAEDISPDSISDLYRAACDWRESGYPDPRPHLRDPLLQGQNLWEFLKAKRVDIHAIDFIGSRLLLCQSSNIQECGRIVSLKNDGNGNG